VIPNPLYRRGDNGPAVVQIRALLAGLGLLDPGGGDAFDDEVDSAVKRFQQERGITIDGIVGPVTLRRLDEAHWRLGDRLLHHQARMMRGDDVAELQARLSDMGFNPGRADGILGPLTDTALRDFQRNVGLAPDGRCGPATLEALGRLSRTVVGGQPVALREHEALLRSGASLSGRVVVVDPGHGGTDAGGRSDLVAGATEADIAYDIASRVEGRLTALGVSAFLSRSRDIEGILDEEVRAAFANAAQADLVVSLHVGASTSAAANGVATYYFGGGHNGAHSAVGERLAELMQEELVARTDLVDGRWHPKTWDLLRHTTMPAVRVEVGYLSNAGDAQRLSDSAFRDAVAEGVTAAIQRLFTTAAPR
jgi:N-acetylmuramoyl-L-alanine amidase